MGTQPMRATPERANSLAGPFLNRDGPGMGKCEVLEGGACFKWLNRQAEQGWINRSVSTARHCPGDLSLATSRPWEAQVAAQGRRAISEHDSCSWQEWNKLEKNARKIYAVTAARPTPRAQDL